MPLPGYAWLCLGRTGTPGTGVRSYSREPGQDPCSLPMDTLWTSLGSVVSRSDSGAPLLSAGGFSFSFSTFRYHPDLETGFCPTRYLFYSVSIYLKYFLYIIYILSIYKSRKARSNLLLPLGRFRKPTVYARTPGQGSCQSTR